MMIHKTQFTHSQQLAQNRLRQMPQAIFDNALLINELSVTHRIYQLFLIPL